jgi:GTP-binding protein
LNIEASFIRSAASASDLPRDGLAEIGLVGRSNVGKSSLINALVRQRVARTSAAPGKTRLANIYRIVRPSSGRPGKRFYLVDLPGFGYSRGADSAREFQELTRAYFGRDGLAALLLVDARHPGLESDVEAWQWLNTAVARTAIVATKIDKLTRGERIRATRELQSVFNDPVLPVSAVTGEGLEDLWKLIDSLANPDNPNNRVNSSRRLPRRPAATAPRAQLRTKPRPRR